VLNIFFGLVTEGASCRVREASFGEVISSPASVVESKPKVREASFGEAIRSPVLLRANQTKYLHFRGAQQFQTFLQGANLMVP